MKALYLRVWLTIVALLALFALAAGLLFQRHVEHERVESQQISSERIAAWADLIQHALPPADADPDVQARALRDWALRLRVPLALDDAQGRRLASSEAFERWAGESPAPAARDNDGDRAHDDERRRDGARRGGGRPGLRVFPIRLLDGRTLWVVRPPRLPLPGRPPPSEGGWLSASLSRMPGASLAALLGLLFVGVAAGAYPVVRRLTRRLESLKQGVEQFGAGQLGRRVDVEGRDEVAALGRSFNEAATRIETLVRSNQSLLANASHELRSPLARMKMALSMLDETSSPPARERLKQELHTNIAELDALVDEVLLASRLDAQATMDRRDPVDLHVVMLEEGARVGAQIQVDAAALAQGSVVAGDERLLRRAARNLLENARRYGGGVIDVGMRLEGSQVTWTVADRGAGVPEAMRDRIFEPFFRMPGHAEREGGVGLGLSLVRQIAERHGGHVRCEAREGGGSVFALTLPLAAGLRV